MTTRGTRAAVFLDRDDTLIANNEITADSDHPGDLFDPALVRLLPGVAKACRGLRDAGYFLVIVSNQGAVARGRCTMREVDACNERLRALLRDEAGADVDAVYMCPFHPKGSVPPFNVEHAWRKPSPGMLLAAAAEHALDLGKAWMIGDARRDIQAAIAAGVASERALLVGSDADARFKDMPGAAARILEQTSHTSLT